MKARLSGQPARGKLPRLALLLLIISSCGMIWLATVALYPVGLRNQAAVSAASQLAPDPYQPASYHAAMAQLQQFVAAQPPSSPLQRVVRWLGLRETKLGRVQAERDTVRRFGEPTGVQSAWQQWEELAQDAGFRQPATKVEANGWTLLGFRIYSLGTELNPLSRVYLLWTRFDSEPCEVSLPARGLWRNDGHLLQIVETANLVPNGDGEPWPGNELRRYPYPWRLMLHPQEAGSKALHMESSEPHGSNFFHVANILGETLFYTELQLNPGQRYLLTADMRAQGQAILALMQTGPGGDNDWPILIRPESSEAGQTQAAISPAVRQSETVLYWGVSGAEAAHATIGNVGLFALPELPPAPCLRSSAMQNNPGDSAEP